MPPLAARLNEAVLTLIAADSDYVRQQAAAAEQLAEAQHRRERAMRCVAALGLSHRRIAELTSLSHTRVNQILGAGEKPVPEAHLSPGVGGPPSTVASAVIRVIASEAARSWKVAELRRELQARNWVCDQLDEVLIELVSDGVLLSVDDGGVTIHAL